MIATLVILLHHHGEKAAPAAHPASADSVAWVLVAFALAVVFVAALVVWCRRAPAASGAHVSLKHVPRPDRAGLEPVPFRVSAPPWARGR